MTEQERRCIEDACRLCEQTCEKLSCALVALENAELAIRERLGFLKATAIVNRKRAGLPPEGQ